MRKLAIVLLLLLLAASTIAFTIRAPGLTQRRLTSPNSTPQCVTSADCPNGEKCVGRRCVEDTQDRTPLGPKPYEPEPIEQPSQPFSAALNRTCTEDTDCPTGQLCDDGLCSSERQNVVRLILKYIAKIQSPPAPDDGSCTTNADCPIGQFCRSNICKTMAEIIDEGGDGSPDPEPDEPEPDTPGAALCQIFEGELYPIKTDIACTPTPASGRILEIINDLEVYWDALDNRHENRVVRILYQNGPLGAVQPLIGFLDGRYCGAGLPPGILPEGDFQVFTRSPDETTFDDQYDIRPEIGWWDEPSYEFPCYHHHFDQMILCDGRLTEKSRSIRINHPDNTKITVRMSGFYPDFAYITEGYCE
ncbi:MAG: hypothetical protein J4215_01635 [Candidatus Diapherotrites archaeon]|uniref:Uncharacterized protein n=1 Tax=Candidatus Iainarchaeum sp. TaxID=3101447 RepID=A0A8T4L444_9ARCH|nr:hypothetical protein [Candidatus Diapherotrites archaeon]